ncbi:MAG: ATP-binding protein [Bacteroidales bacterium]
MDEQFIDNHLTRLENISRAAAKCGLNLSSLTKLQPDIEAVSSFLGITTAQTVLFAVIADLSLQRTLTLEGLAKHFDCSVLRLVTYMKETESLEKRGFVKRLIRRRGRRPSYNDIGFMVPAFVIDALLQADPAKLEAATRFDLPAFLKQISDLVDEREESTISTAQVLEEVGFLIAANKHLPFVSYVDSGLKTILGKCALFAFSFVRLKGQVSVDFESFANSLFDDLSQQLDFCQELASGRHELVKTGFLKLISSEFDGEKNASLSPRTARELYHSYPNLLKPENDRSGLIDYKSLKNKNLLFCSGLQEQLDLLEDIMQPSKFRSYCRQLKRNGLTSGITAVFSGEPGTGKTEEVYQLARRTKRSIMMVDLSQMRSKWFGESEKRVKQVFDDYEAIRKASLVEPILFINEADGLLTRRIDLSASNESSDRVTNTMQNVLLQALENFKGILIATTNLTGNLDRAYERRFSFRLDFPRPDKHIRASIWKEKLPVLTHDEARILGERFEISGGEIDNQVRQVLLKKVLRKEGDLFNTLNESCKSVHGFSFKKRVGF